MWKIIIIFLQQHFHILIFIFIFILIRNLQINYIGGCIYENFMSFSWRKSLFFIMWIISFFFFSLWLEYIHIFLSCVIFPHFCDFTWIPIHSSMSELCAAMWIPRMWHDLSCRVVHISSSPSAVEHIVQILLGVCCTSATFRTWQQNSTQHKEQSSYSIPKLLDVLI